MPDKKADAPKPSPEDEALQKRVEMIMGDRNADGVTPAVRNRTVDQPPEIDIFKDPKTAPTVPPKLLEQIGAAPKQPAAAPVAEKSAVAAVVAKDMPAETEPSEADNLDDTVTDKAVDEIARSESDTVLAAEDEAAAKSAAAVKKKSSANGGKSKFGRVFKSKWFWAGFGIVIVALFALPMTRYTVLGLFIKESVSVTVTDSKSTRGVSNAVVSLGGQTAKSDVDGKAVLHVPVGSTTLTVTKQYYKPYSVAYTVAINSGQTVAVSLVATGRQVPVIVVNTITGKPIAGAQVGVLDTTAKTDMKGKAVIVLPITKTSQTATISLSGYNTAHVTVQVTDQVVAANTFKLTPAGTVYFLSNLSGKIDVVKANLDGTNRQTVLAGTGKEDPNNTILLAARDWRYLVLEAQRDSAQPALYLIDTTSDKVTNFDSGNDSFTLIGWYGHSFVYDVTLNSTSAWTSGKEVIKSYNADDSQLNLLDQNQAQGAATSYAYQGFYNFYIVNGLLTYNTQWYTYDTGGSGYDLTGKSDTIRGMQTNGQNKKDYQNIDASGISDIQAALFEPNGVYYAVYNYTDNKTTYYQFENQSVTTVTNLDQTNFNQAYPTYLVSPSGNQTFWAEQRDGKNTLFTGDSNAKSPKQIATLSDYSPYGWYGDGYLLVSKGGSELYIMPATPLATSQQAMKISDYYKPTQSFQGYGYDYGGL